MDNSLFSRYKECKNWSSYYQLPINVEILFPNNNECESVRCRDFIKKHFEHGQKGEAFALDFYDKYDKKGKHCHVVSLYLLGLHMEKLFSARIHDSVIKMNPDNNKWYHEKEFKYTWFLSSLYHDIASCIEHEKDMENTALSEILQQIVSDPKGLFNRYSRETVTSYLKYREDSKANDHGIIGGILLYKKLKENFDKKTEGHNWRKEKVLYKDGLAWREEHKEHYRYVADSIICHNMWTVPIGDTKNVEKYISYNLEELIIDSEKKKLSIEAYPLHFMLCLLDSIEPVKRFLTFSPRTVLENVAIDYEKEWNNDGKDTIKIAWDDTIKSDPGFWDWMKSIYSLSDWMRVKVSECKGVFGGCSLSIKIL